MSIRQWNICVNIFQKLKVNVQKSWKKATKEDFGNNMHHGDTMKTITKAYLSNLECSVQEAVYHILPELKLRRIFPAVYFVNTNLPEERFQVLIPEKNLANYQTIAQIFSRDQILIVLWKDQVQHSVMENVLF